MRWFICFLFVIPIVSNAQSIQVGAGSIKRFENFKSVYVDPRNVDVWVPSDYSTAVKYDVVYMQDGQMLFDSTSNWNHQEWQVDETAEKLMQSKKIRNAIIVGIWNNGAYRRSEYFPQKCIEAMPPELKDTLIANYLLGKVLADNYLLFLTRELKPFIDSAFSTNTSLSHTTIAGSSMGGLISLYAICEYPQLFGAAACMSTNWLGVVYKNESIAPFFIAYLKQKLPDPNTHKIYFDYGSLGLDSLYKPVQLKVDELMRAHKYSSKNWITKEFPGETHSERAWSMRLAIPFEFLLQLD
ncbi:MAG: alpha/beta hydrolase [Bacteroidetes bacterium]|nr:alpha/beta hydrolase [Bacteroidota bacterium]